MPRASKKPGKKSGASISELARRTRLDRATVRTRLNKAGVKQKAKGKKNDKIFDAGEALSALTVGQTGLTSSRKKSLDIDAALKMLKLKKARGELVDRPAALNEQARIFRWIFKELTVRRRKAITIEIRKARNLKEAEAIYETKVTDVFNELRSNYPEHGIDD